MYFNSVLSFYNNNTSTLVSLQYGDTPLHYASANGHEAVVEVLLKADADHSIKNRVSMVECILSSSFICFIIIIIIIQVHLCHYSMVTHLYTKHQAMVTRLLLRCY